MNKLLGLVHDVANRTTLIGSTLSIMKKQGIQNLTDSQLEAFDNIKKWNSEIDGVLDKYYVQQKGFEGLKPL